jgi:ABC-2 type transport system ATP-binding protein
VNAIVIEGLSKRYGDIVAVDDLSLEIAEGEIFVLLGPNGAGKTTTVEIVEGLREPDEGAARIFDTDPRERSVRERIGVMPQTGDLYAGIKVREAMRLFASFYSDAEDAEALMERLDLVGVRNTTYRRLSGGEKRRLSLALALIGKPDVAFLDEPTAEMDVEGRSETWELVRELRTRGSTVVLTTHQLDEAERVADRVAIMDGGKLVAVGKPAELGSDRPPAIDLVLAAPVDTAAFASALGATVVETGSNAYRVSGADIDPSLISRVTTWLAGRGVLALSIKTGPRSLEEIYLDLVNR